MLNMASGRRATIERRTGACGTAAVIVSMRRCYVPLVQIAVPVSAPWTGPVSPVELLLAVDRDGPHTLGAQIEEQLRAAIRDGRAASRARRCRRRATSPRQLGVSRRVAVEAYAQLAAEGYLSLRQGARPRVSDTAAAAAGAGAAPTAAAPPRGRASTSARASPTSRPSRAPPGCAALREALTTMTDADLGYGDPCGVDALRAALADYLGRVRGVVADPGRRRRHQRLRAGPRPGLPGARRGGREADRARGPEQPGAARDRPPRRASSRSRSRSTSDGLRVDALERARVDAVVVTPAHQHPTGVVLAAERRTALLAWLRDRDAIAIEDDYDAEYRYDRAAVGALQGLEPGADRLRRARRARRSRPRCGSAGWSSRPTLLDAVRAREAASPTRARRGSSSTRSPTSSRAASSTATCAGCAPATAPGATRSSRRSPTSCPRRRVRGDRRRAARHRRAARRPRRARDPARGGAAAASRSAPCATTATTTGRTARPDARLRPAARARDPRRRPRARRGDQGPSSRRASFSRSRRERTLTSPNTVPPSRRIRGAPGGAGGPTSPVS